VCALVAVLLCSVACPHGAPAPAQPAAPADVVSAARGVIEQWRQAYEVRSADALEKLYTHDPDLVLVQDGTAIVGWTAVKSALDARIQHAKEIHVKLQDVKVSSLAPTVATATATMTREIGDGITTVNENGALTLVLRKDEDGWKIAGEHYSYKRP